MQYNTAWSPSLYKISASLSLAVLKNASLIIYLEALDL